MHMNRRKILQLSLLTGLAYTFSESIATTTINTMQQSSQYTDGRYVLPALPYDYNALEPLMDEATLRLHHDKHHAAYVAGANAALDQLAAIAEGKGDNALTSHWVRTLAFHASGHALHSIFWTNMSPKPKTAPEGALAEAIKESFGSLDNLMRMFKSTAAAVEGSGWAVLGVEPMSGKLTLCGAEKHQNLEITGVVPILVCDVWEHAYYLKHQNNRVAFIEDFVKLIDWKNVEERYNNVKA